MHVQDIAILKALVSVAWADGRVTAEETQVIDGLLAGYHATPSEAHEIRAFAREPKTLDDIAVSDLSLDDRRVLLQHAVLLTMVDGEQHEKELAMLKDLAQRLRIPALEVPGLLQTARLRARDLLGSLKS
ncbi:MAG: DUF533 domain-containing protein [Polyangiaceae bacterium]|nr:DUF533 domain-containing protein [Polyangiaceae bacterium]